MDDVGVLGDDIDWEHLFDSIPEMANIFDNDSSILTGLSPVDGFSNPSPDSVSSWIGEIEHMLMKDDEGHEGDKVASEPSHDLCNEFLLDMLVGSPAGDANASDDQNYVDFLADQSGDVCASDDQNYVDLPADQSGHVCASDDQNYVDLPADQSGHVCASDDQNYVDLPADQSGHVCASDDQNSDSNVSDCNGISQKEKVLVSEENKTDADEDEDADPVAKKRKRQLRNRDAAVRSRERKKMYVRDLEMKSRYLEGECRRLGRLLECCFAENQALRFTLQTGKVAFDASMTKQESAVLLLECVYGATTHIVIFVYSFDESTTHRESLLLGSLLWFLGIVCLFHLPKLPQFPLEAVPLEGVANKGRVNVAPRRAGSKILGSLVIPVSFKSRTCKASKTKMKPSFLASGILA